MSGNTKTFQKYQIYFLSTNITPFENLPTIPTSFSISNCYISTIAIQTLIYNHYNAILVRRAIKKSCWKEANDLKEQLTYKRHTHTHIYIYVCVCVCVVCAY